MDSKASILGSFSCFLVLMGSSYSETDALLQGQNQKGRQLVSAFGTFSWFGFHDIGMGRYEGIWYNTLYGKVEQYSKDCSDYWKQVWVANRNKPISIFDNLKKNSFFSIAHNNYLFLSLSFRCLFSALSMHLYKQRNFLLLIILSFLLMYIIPFYIQFFPNYYYKILNYSFSNIYNLNLHFKISTYLLQK